MNENTAKLLEQLAQKLGTTSEYLWKVLLKQAPIDATVNLIQIMLIMLFGLVLYKIHRRLMKEDANNDTGYYKYEEMAAIPMIIGGVVFAIMFIWAFCCIGDVVNGYFNPEYWALNKVLSSVKQQGGNTYCQRSGLCAVWEF